MTLRPFSRPTLYKGKRMRSRLEASFAEHCDRMKVPWSYEPICFADETGQYLPDFGLGPKGKGGAFPVYVEVKPTCETAEAALARMTIIWSSFPGVLLVATHKLATGVWRPVVLTSPESGALLTLPEVFN